MRAVFRSVQNASLFAFVFLTTHPAFAQALMGSSKGSDKWVEPLVGLINNLNSGFGRVGKLLVGVCLLVWAVKSLFEERIDVKGFAVKVVLGLFIIYVDDIVSGLIGV
jgi:hypothetical protein